MELSGPGVQYISDNQLYNSIITAHAILMSAPLCLNEWPVPKEPVETDSHVKDCRVGEVKPLGETQTTKPAVTGVDEPNIQGLRPSPYLSHTPFRITNLIIRVLLHNRNSTK
jgi:hypothetical protein